MIINRWILALKRYVQRETEFRRIQNENRRKPQDIALLFTILGGPRGPGGALPAANILRLGEAVAQDRRIWDRTNLTFAEQTHLRQKPLGFYKIQIELLKYIGGKTIVEVGSARAKLCHLITEFNPVCCNDGHSTYHWASTPSFDVFTVDIDPESRRNLDRAGLKNLRTYTADGIAFLKAWSGPPIDLLYLDAWDVGVPEYAEKHLAAYHAIKNKLSTKHIIGIDDTDFAGEGKGKYLVPFLVSAGYRLIASGRQTIFVNFDVG